MAGVRGEGEPHMANSLATRSGESNQEATKTIMDLPCELHQRILEQLAWLDYYYLYDLKETSKYFENLCQNFIKRNPELNYRATIESHNQLVEAASLDELDRVKFYIEEEKIDVDSVGRTGFTALHLASGSGHIEVVNYLISKGANVNITGNRRAERHLRSATPLMFAANRGQVEIAKILIQNGAKTDPSLMRQAAASNNPEMISLVMTHGFDIDGDDDRNKTPLAIAIKCMAEKNVKFLLENGADYRKTSDGGFLPIHGGIVVHHDYELDPDERCWGTERCLELLLNHIEQKEGKKGVVDYINNNDNSAGLTTLHEACGMNNHYVVELLYSRGADPNIRDKKGKKPYDHGFPEAAWLFWHVDVKNWFETEKQHQDCTPESRCYNGNVCRQNRKRRQYVNAPSVTSDSQQGERNE